MTSVEVLVAAAVMSAGALWLIARYLERIAVAVESLNRKAIVPEDDRRKADDEREPGSA